MGWAATGVVHRLNRSRHALEKQPHNHRHDRGKQQPTQKQHADRAHYVDQPIHRPPANDRQVAERERDNNPKDYEGSDRNR